MTLYEIATVVIAVIALIISVISLVTSMKNSSAMIELTINERITNTKEKVGDVSNIMTPFLAKQEPTAEEKRIIDLYTKQFDLAIENNLNAYEEACAKYLDKKVDKKRFKKIYKTEKCVCDPIPKNLGQIFISVGFTLFMFMILPTSGTPCSIVTGIIAFFSAILFLAIGFLTMNAWYNNNKLTCPLIICDLWCAISGILATSIALIAIPTVWGLIFLQSGGLTNYAAGAALAVLIVTTFAGIIWYFGPLSNPPCMHTQTCK